MNQNQEIEISPINQLENFLDEYEGKTLLKSQLEDYEQWGYEEDDYVIFKHHLKFMLDNCYNIRIIDDTKKKTKKIKHQQA